MEKHIFLMTKEQFCTDIRDAVEAYLAYPSDWGEDAQIAINPETWHISLISSAERLAVIADSEETVEDLTGYQRPADEDGADAQVRRNPDLYPVSTLIKINGNGQRIADERAIRRLADSY